MLTTRVGYNESCPTNSSFRLQDTPTSFAARLAMGDKICALIAIVFVCVAPRCSAITFEPQLDCFDAFRGREMLSSRETMPV